MHKWISTDNGDHCYLCGVVLDYGATDEQGVIDWDDPRTDEEHDLAHGLLPYCIGPVTERAHHYVLGGLPGSGTGYGLECAYGDSVLDGTQERPETEECVAA